MSTFSGKLHEETLNFIRIDQFQEQNHDGYKFFLSHFHSDHFRGIFDDKFIKQLESNDDKMLYCSEFTKKLILNKSEGRIPENKIFAMAPHSPYMISFQDREPVEVRTIPAGHCPGSVMFLIEQGSMRVLYTGDFRIPPDELKKFNAFHDKTGSVKRINTLYLDATFCHPSWLTFPSREESLEEVMILVKSWLDEKPEHEVGIRYNSYHGLEWILMRLANSLDLHKGIWVVHEESYKNYACIPELERALCQNKGNTRIHLCPVTEGDSCLICTKNRSVTKTLKPCAFSFNTKQLAEGRTKEGYNVVRVAYATHSSFEELVGAVKYWSPQKIHICALCDKASEKEALDFLKINIEEHKKQLFENKENQALNLPLKKRPRLELPDQGRSSQEKVIETIELVSSSEDEIEIMISESDMLDLDTPPL